MARTKCRTGIQQTKINEQFLMSRADDKTLSKINNHYPFKQYSKRHEYKVAFYKIKYKKYFIINKVSLLLKGHTERVLFFIHLRNKKYLTASKSEIIIWDQNNLKPIQKIRMKEEDKITKIIQLSNEDIVIGCGNRLMKYKLEETSYKEIVRFELANGTIYDIKKINESNLCVVFFKEVYIVEIKENNYEIHKVDDSLYQNKKEYLTFFQALKFNKDEVIILNFEVNNSFKYNLTHNRVSKLITTFSLQYNCPFNYLKSIHLLSSNTLLIDSGDYLTKIKLESDYTSITYSKKFISLPSLKLFDKKQYADFDDLEKNEFSLINLDNNFYIKRIGGGIGLIDAENFDLKTLIWGPKEDIYFYIPMDKLEDGVYLHFGEDGNVYTLE